MSKPEDPYFPEVPVDAYKYSKGVVGVVAGSVHFPGAAVLCVGGARRGGAGYVKYLAQHDFPTHLVLQNYPDVVPITELVGQEVDAWVLGSGSPDLTHFPSGGILVLDGSAMTLSNSVHEGITIVTPHEGEAAKLGYRVTDRKATALKMASELNVLVVLKGPGTVIATPSGLVEVEKTGGRELATAGTGDILAGLMASMIAAWKPTTFEEAAKVAVRAVRAHGTAGKIAATKSFPVVATDVLAALPKVFL
jgi:NAD(P)H-hydrate repair Nnr-like enzyme with NAD(P)H-hydrate dehydratase domain